MILAAWLFLGLVTGTLLQALFPHQYIGTLAAAMMIGLFMLIGSIDYFASQHLK